MSAIFTKKSVFLSYNDFSDTKNRDISEVALFRFYHRLFYIDIWKQSTNSNILSIDGYAFSTAPITKTDTAEQRSWLVGDNSMLRTVCNHYKQYMWKRTNCRLIPLSHQYSMQVPFIFQVLEPASRTSRGLEKYWKSWTNVHALKTFLIQVAWPLFRRKTIPAEFWFSEFRI